MATIPVGLTPTRLVLSRHGRRLYVVNGDSVSVIGPKTTQAMEAIPVSGLPPPRHGFFAGREHPG